ncbi:TetR/AcrR family transcriptional regulator [Dactylosporangium sp. NPDC051541]|uniref:TetR/AcrR family transcriptional regulator n=1 Tax=Dactylosporangium sp. NPDC051541 TaxID=3363977 RepID=UPI0037A04BE3
MPRLWNATIDEHRRTVHAAILDTAAALIAEHGLAGVTMSQIAAQAGIGRATLYKYFPDVEAIVVAWHERQVTEHLAQLTAAAAAPAEPAARLRTVLHTLAELTGGRHEPAAHGPGPAVSLHRAEHLHHARRQLHAMLTDVIAAAAAAGDVRTDMPAADLATFALHALGAAAAAGGPAAGPVELTLAALRVSPPSG